MKPAWWSLTPYRLRLLSRGAFLLLALATVALALYVLREEKQLSYRNYQYGFSKTQAQIAAKLHHPAGQLALLNPRTGNDNLVPLRPLLLPYTAIDFDDQYKVQQAVEMAGCLVQYRDGTLCTAIGSNPWAGGFVYVAGSFASSELVAHARGEDDLSLAHRVRVVVSLRGQTYRWIAPFELLGQVDARPEAGVRGRLTGFVDRGRVMPGARPVRDFRGWIWQDGHCDTVGPMGPVACSKRSFFSLRLPVGVLRDALFMKQKLVWPPADLDQIQVHVQVLPPGEGPPLLDSNSPEATLPFALTDLAPLLLPGEQLRLRKLPDAGQPDLLQLTGVADEPYQPSRLISSVIRRLAVAGYDQPLEARETIATPLGSYQLILTGDVRSVNRNLAVVATRVSWFVGAMLLAIMLAWLAIEIGIIRRITVLTRRAASVSRTVRGVGELDQIDLSDMRGHDELGVLAAGLADLLQRVKEDVAREHIRAEQEKDMWHAVGHEIMSPLQSLMALHGGSDDDSSRYIHRMQQAIRVLYGTASPSEAFQSTTLQAQAIDIAAFLQHVAANAPSAGIAEVHYQGPAGPLWARADEYPLEDVVTHVLRNADRYRPAGSHITLQLQASDTAVTVAICNQGPAIAEDMLDKIFEYGVSDQAESGALGNRGQGLFVARTYMAKMGGTITARNLDDGVCFELVLQRAVGA
ncbi:sensor histidine kinase [Chitinimonas sp. JJ19]|uniref:sensor histidine kinase n=1 Tax=Chitinimonas sp. JJ19 TaxID=3109352 RepID=UPI003002F0DE